MEDYQLNLVNLSDDLRVYAEYDQNTEKPDYSEQWPVFEVRFVGWSYRAEAVNTEADEYQSPISEFLLRHGSDWDLLKRWLRICFGAKHVEQIDTRDSTYFVFDPEELREKYNIDPEHYNAEQNVKAEAKVYKAWFDGEVFLMVLQERRTGTKNYSNGDIERFEEWQVVDCVGGYYGWESVEEEDLKEFARECGYEF